MRADGECFVECVAGQGNQRRKNFVGLFGGTVTTFSAPAEVTGAALFDHPPGGGPKAGASCNPKLLAQSGQATVMKLLEREIRNAGIG